MMVKYIQDGRVFLVHNLDDAAEHLANNFQVGHKTRVQVKMAATPSRERDLTADENTYLLGKAQEIVKERERLACANRSNLIDELRPLVQKAREELAQEAEIGEDL
jgi:hypothetical protein